MQKRGGTKQSIKIETSHILLNKRNIIFMLIFVLLLIMIIYFVIKAWPIMQERLGDEDSDNIKNYQDKCMSTVKGATVDSYGCEIVKGSIHVEKPVLIEEDIEEESESVMQCSDSDGGKNIWIKGKCNDGSEKKDYCEENFGNKLYEYSCLNNICDKEKIYCSDYNALCYDGRCIDKNKDTDKDGYPDLDEYGNGTDPNNPDDHPENITIQSNCNSHCVSLGYVSGRGPVGSIGNCNSPEIGQYLSGNSGDVCCCTPSNQPQQQPCTDSDGNNISIKGYVVDISGTKHDDECVDNANVYENICLNNIWIKNKITCPSGEYCEGGRCMKPKWQCTDSDVSNAYPTGLDSYTKGTCVGERTNYDTCRSTTSLLEWYCCADGCCIQDTGCGFNEECRDGRCIPLNLDSDGDGYTDIKELEIGSNPFDKTSPSSCKDWDNTQSVLDGTEKIPSYVNGYYNGQEFNIKDYCSPSNIWLYEMRCRPYLVPKLGYFYTYLVYECRCETLSEGAHCREDGPITFLHD